MICRPNPAVRIPGWRKTSDQTHARMHPVPLGCPYPSVDRPSSVEWPYRRFQLGLHCQQVPNLGPHGAQEGLAVFTLRRFFLKLSTSFLLNLYKLKTGRSSREFSLGALFACSCSWDRVGPSRILSLGFRPSFPPAGVDALD